MIDSDCENYIALYSPVAIDLRLVLSLLKINDALERIGDFAEGIARFAMDNYNPAYKDLVDDIFMKKIYGERDLSWMYFNQRILQEAGKKDILWTPVCENGGVGQKKCIFASPLPIYWD